jgi:hypothetical protein
MNISDDIIIFQLFPFFDNELLSLIRLNKRFRSLIQRYLQFKKSSHIQDLFCMLCKQTKNVYPQIVPTKDLLHKSQQIITLNNMIEKSILCSTCSNITCNDYQICTHKNVIRLSNSLVLYCVYHSGLKRHTYQYMICNCEHDSILHFLLHI